MTLRPAMHRALRFAAAGLALVLIGACGEAPAPSAVAADPEQGRLLLQQFGCGHCHRIPGVAGARGHIGPPLDAVGRRVYLGGVLPNTPGNMVRWIRAPHAFDPPTAMPDLGVTEPHARAMTAYLQRLR